MQFPYHRVLHDGAGWIANMTHYDLLYNIGIMAFCKTIDVNIYKYIRDTDMITRAFWIKG